MNFGGCARAQYGGMMKQDLPIETKVQELISRIYILSKHFPKSEKFVLAAELRTSALTIQRLTVTALKRYHKKTTLTDLDIEIALLFRRIRLAHEMRYVDTKKYRQVAEILAEIGRMVGGWIRSSMNPKAKVGAL